MSQDAIGSTRRSVKVTAGTGDVKTPEIYADFNNLDDDGRIRLTTLGSVTDIARLGIKLRAGLKLTLATDDADDQGNTDDLMADAVVQYNAEQKCWVAQIDWTQVKNRSERERLAASRRSPGVKNGATATEKKRRGGKRKSAKAR